MLGTLGTARHSEAIPNLGIGKFGSGQQRDLRNGRYGPQISHMRMGIDLEQTRLYYELTADQCKFAAQEKFCDLDNFILKFVSMCRKVSPQPAQDSYPPLVWPQSCSYKVPKGLSKNILKKLKRKMWAKLPSGSTFAGDETHQLTGPSISGSENI